MHVNMSQSPSRDKGGFKYIGRSLKGDRSEMLPETGHGRRLSSVSRTKDMRSVVFCMSNPCEATGTALLGNFAIAKW